MHPIGRRPAALCLFLGGALSLAACEREKVTAPPPPAGDVLLDTTVDPTAGPDTVEVANVIRIAVPQGAVPAASRLTIVRPFPQNVPGDSLITPYEVLDVTLGTGSTFAAPLEVTIYYDPAVAPAPAFPGQMGAAWYNEAWSRWTVFPDAVIDTMLHTVTFETTHLTKLSRYVIHGYTDWRQSSHFNIYWVASGPDAPLSDALYGNKPPWHTGTDPDYIQDLEFYLERAHAKFDSLGLTVATSKVNVYVKKMKDDGETSYLGSLSICNDANGGTVARPARDALPMAAAHEYLHYVQDYYYMQFFADYTIKWWLEATATQADRMIWPQKAFFESVDYTNRQLDQFMQKSWDDCNADPNHYVAGGFLAYLSAYRTGAKAEIDELIRRGGGNTASYMRTILDDYLRTSLQSPGIGSEFADYVRWAYEGLGFIQLMRSNPVPAGGLESDVPVMLKNAKPTYTVNQKLPHLSARVAKIVMDENTPAIDISIDRHQTAPINVSTKIDGRSLGLHGNNVNVTVSGTVTGPGSIGVVRTNQGADDGMFEDPLRGVQIIFTRGAALGVIQNLSVSFSTPRTLTVDSLATAGWKWQWSGYSGGHMSLYNMDTGAWEHPQFTGDSYSAPGPYHVPHVTINAYAPTDYTTPSGTVRRTYNFSVGFDGQ